MAEREVRHDRVAPLDPRGRDDGGRLREHVPETIARCRALLLLGDTNSSLAAYPAKRRKIPVFHMEAGNRCFDDRVPEEVNRRVIDHSSSVLMPYTYRSAENLVREGIERRRVYVTGNPIKEVLDHYADKVAAADPFTEFGVEPGKYFLMTAHRAETVDVPERLTSLIQAVNTHLLVHDVRVDLPGRDSVRDFLALDGYAVKVEDLERV